MDLKSVRNEIDKLDNTIKNLLVFRMATIPLVAKIKKENNMELHQPGREEAIYKKIDDFADKTGIDNNLLKGIYKEIIKNALQIEDDVISGEYQNSNVNVSNELLYQYERLNRILENDIPQIIDKILELSPENNLTKIVEGIYERRIQDEL